jgi:hypothetical protein
LIANDFCSGVENYDWSSIEHERARRALGLLR